MKTSLILPCVLLVALVGCKASSNPASAPAPSPEPTEPQAQSSAAPRPFAPFEPKYGWKEFHAETFETHPVHSAHSERQFAVPNKASRLRVKVNASSAVLGGVLPNDVFVALLRLPHKNLRTEDFRKMPCFIELAEKANVTCDIDPSKKMAFVVRDGRAEGTEAAGFLGMKTKSQRLVEHATLPDKISISLATWQCIENCKKP